MSLEIIDAMDRDLTSEKTVLNLSGKTRLHELCDLIAECDVLVSNDSGPMHIGYAVGTPLVALFGSTSPALTGPPDCFFDGAEFGYAFRVLKEDIECSPCFERTCRFGHLACMDRISPEAVINAVKEIIPGRKAIFFDRDGTLCKNARYLSSMDDLDIFPETGELASLKGNGYLIIGISNQSGIARGIVREDFVREVHRIFIEHYGFDAFYYCPHHPDDRCACRKPMPGMLLKARAELKIDLRKSFFAGDSHADMATAKMAGARSVHIAADTADTLEFADFRIHNLRQLFSLVGE
jgi:heptosyltransferase-2